MRTPASWILRCLLPSRDIDALLGDLEEECRLQPRATRWYWSQIVRSVPVLLWASVRQGGVIATFAVAAGACIVQGIVEIAIKLAVVNMFTTNARVAALVSLAVTLPILVAVSYFAARIRPGAATVFAALIVVAVAIQLLAKSGDAMPFWTQVAALFVGPSAAFAGGVISARGGRPG